MKGLGKVHPPDTVVLKDIWLSFLPGAKIGVLGMNGAGKSTLLKILSRITEPTTGRVDIHGKVGSLLEVGTGFHPELTGRENIYLNGAILGMGRRELERSFDEIVDFAEIERFLDTPVKRYSSGMYVRLAFAVAAHLEPEILLVDEVLAVGDVAFQNKCLGKMDNVAREGRTVFFVSHNMASTKRLCNTVICLSKGRVVAKGEPHSVITNFLQESLNGDGVIEIPEQAHLIKSPLRISSVEVLNSRREPTGLILLGEDIHIKLGIIASEPIRQAEIGLGLQAEGVRVATVHSPRIDVSASSIPQYLTCVIPGDILLPNFYSLHLGARASETGKDLDWVADAVGFRIEPLTFDQTDKYEPQNFGLLALTVDWTGDVLREEAFLRTSEGWD